MRTKIYFTLIFLALAISLHAVAPPRGPERLRELVIFPEIDLHFNFEMGHEGNNLAINPNMNLPDKILQIQEELKSQPNDVKKIIRLGNLLDNNDQTNESAVYYQKAEQLCRKKLSENPRDGLVLMDLAEAENELGQTDEAENFYRKATLVSSNDWRCWVELGNFLPDKYFSAMLPENLRSHFSPFEMPSQEFLDYRPSSDALKKSEAALAEASCCFDRALTLAPKEPEVFFQHAGYICTSNWQSYFFRHFSDNEKIDSSTLLLDFFSRETAVDLEKAAALSPKNYQEIGLAAYWEWCNAALESKSTNFTSDILPDAPRKFIHGAMTRLENLSEDSDKKTAAGALENLGLLNMTFGNSSAAIDDFHRAVLLDPTREQSWDLWLGMLLERNSPDEWLKVCEARLKTKDSARNHLLLSKVYVHMENWDKAIEQGKIAYHQETNNIVPPLMLAAIALKRSSDTNYLSKATQCLSYAEKILKSMPVNDERRTRWRELMLDCAIASGLVDTSSNQKAARECIETIFKYFPDDADAKNILSALN